MLHHIYMIRRQGCETNNPAVQALLFDTTTMKKHEQESVIALSKILQPMMHGLTNKQ